MERTEKTPPKLVSRLTLVAVLVALVGLSAAVPAAQAETIGGNDDAAKTREAGELGNELAARKFASKSQSPDRARQLLNGDPAPSGDTPYELVRQLLPLVLFFAVALLLIKPLGLGKLTPGQPR